MLGVGHPYFLRSLVSSTVLALMFTGCSKRPPPEKEGAELFVVKTWTMKDCSVAPWAVAERQGYFKTEGIRVEYTGDTAAQLRISSILSGTNDVGAFHPSIIAVAKSAGARITAVAEGDIEPSDPGVDPKFRSLWWFVNPQRLPTVSSFPDLAQLPNKIKVATSAINTFSGLETKRLAKKYRIPESRIEWVRMPDIQAIQSLQQGLVDVSEMRPAFYAAMQATGAKKIADSSELDMGPAAGISYFVFRDKMIKEHPQQVAAFVRAIEKAQLWANTHPDQTTKIAGEVVGVPITGIHYFSTSLGINENLAAPWLEDLERSGFFAPGRLTPAMLVTHEIEQINATGIGK